MVELNAIPTGPDLLLPTRNAWLMEPPEQPMSWPAPSAHEVQHPLGVDEIHIWAAALEPKRTLHAWTEMLSPSERERARRFHFEQHRRRFIVGRGVLRSLLGRYLEADPCEIELGVGAFGKPMLAGRFEGNALQFNVSHTEDLALLAFTRAGQIGVDVERVRPLEDAGELVARFFSRRENAAFQRLAAELQPAAFFSLWTRKEAWLKATGEGIAHSLRLVEVAFLPGETAELLSVPEHLAKKIQWELRQLDPAPGFAAAVAVGGCTSPQLCCWQWDGLAGS
jgi:4'-phosphopantetheinyl transferase